MDAVALAATIGGSAVALAGVGATVWGAKQQRESVRELAASQQAHERQLASGARLFERRSAVYERLIGVLQRWVEQVDRTEPILRWANEPEPPEQPSADEQRALNTVLRTFGSPAVADAYDDCVKSVRDFFIQAATMRTLREQQAPNLQWEQLEQARTKVRADVATIERRVSNELAGL
jgi:hypothetical protein